MNTTVHTKTEYTPLWYFQNGMHSVLERSLQGLRHEMRPCAKLGIRSLSGGCMRTRLDIMANKESMRAICRQDCSTLCNLRQPT